MSYARNTEPVGCCDPKEMRGTVLPEKPLAEPLVDLMNETNEVGLAILAMAEKIEGNLFGEGNSREGANPSPTCFRHALDNHRSTLVLAADALCRICNQLGV